MTVHFIGLRSDLLLRFILFVCCSLSTLECLIVLSVGIIRVTQKPNFHFMHLLQIIKTLCLYPPLPIYHLLRTLDELEMTSLIWLVGGQQG